MPRDFSVNGECLVKVKGMTGSDIETLSELGLALDNVTVTPVFRHHDIRIDDFGPNIPVEVLWMLAECRIEMTLFHFDWPILEACVSESMGGETFGELVAAGTPMGAGKQRFAEGNHFISVNLLSPVLDRPWRFLHCYLADNPITVPLGTSSSAVGLRWRCIPYLPIGAGSPGQGPQEMRSDGVVLFDRVLDA